MLYRAFKEKFSLASSAQEGDNESTQECAHVTGACIEAGFVYHKERNPDRWSNESLQMLYKAFKERQIPVVRLYDGS